MHDSTRRLMALFDKPVTRPHGAATERDLARYMARGGDPPEGYTWFDFIERCWRVEHA